MVVATMSLTDGNAIWKLLENTKRDWLKSRLFGCLSSESLAGGSAESCLSVAHYTTTAKLVTADGPIRIHTAMFVL
jgi:hypothetical protein